MNIEVGKSYIMRNGVTVLVVSEIGSEAFRSMRIDGPRALYRHEKDGRGMQSCHDIVSEA